MESLTSGPCRLLPCKVYRTLRMSVKCVIIVSPKLLLVYCYYIIIMFLFLSQGKVSLFVFALILHSNDAGFEPGTTASALPIIAITLVYDFFCEALKIFTKLGGGGFA